MKFIVDEVPKTPGSCVFSRFVGGRYICTLSCDGRDMESCEAVKSFHGRKCPHLLSIRDFL